MVYSTYRCLGGSGPDECSAKTTGFAELIKKGLDATGAVYYAKVLSTGYGKCGSIWGVRECAMLVPSRNMTDGTKILRLTNPTCAVDIRVSNGIKSVVKPKYSKQCRSTFRTNWRHDRNYKYTS